MLSYYHNYLCLPGFMTDTKYSFTMIHWTEQLCIIMASDPWHCLGGYIKTIPENGWWMVIDRWGWCFIRVFSVYGNLFYIFRWRHARVVISWVAIYRGITVVNIVISHFVNHLPSPHSPMATTLSVLLTTRSSSFCWYSSGSPSVNSLQRVGWHPTVQ